MAGEETYKLTYFDLRGRGEPARLMFSMAGQKFEDDRIRFRDWLALKPKTPQGFLPVLETSRGVISQTVAVTMYVAGKLGFAPDDDFDRAQTSSILITINDTMSFASKNYLRSEIYKIAPTPDDIEQKKQAVKEELNKMIEFVESLSKKGAQYIFGDKITVADCVLFITMNRYIQVFSEANFGGEWFESFNSRMRADPRVVEYLQQRVTPEV